MNRINWVCRATRFTSRVALFPFFSLVIDGVENLPQKTAFVLLPKHQCWQDIPLISLATPRSLYYVAKHELFRNPVLDWFLRSLGGIPLNRQRPLESRGSIRALIGFLRKGEGVVVFPEGTYYRNRMGPGRVGMVRLILLRLSLPFVPVGIHYGDIGTKVQVRVRFGSPMHAGRGTDAGLFLEKAMKEIAELSGLQISVREEQTDDGVGKELRTNRQLSG